MLNALLLENIHPSSHEEFEANGVHIETRAGALDTDELIRALQGKQILGIRSKTHVNSEVLQAAPDLLTIGAYCIGTTQIDLEAAARAGVAVFNAPFSNTRSVVELAVAEIIALTRRLTERDRALHEGIWMKSADGAHEVRGRTLGIVGYGNIGSQLSVLAENLGMRVLYYDVAEKLGMGNARRIGDLHSMLAQSDVVTLHIDDRLENTEFFGEREFAAMPSGSIFINLSRGFVVDYPALRDAITTGHIAGAAVDVFPEEPKGNGDEFHSELRGLPNVILTPHIGGSTEEAQESIGQFVTGKLMGYAKYGSTMLSVNLPQLRLEASPGDHRVAHLHHNTPGVLASMNQGLARKGTNIVAQMLATRGDIGYVVTDVATPVDPDGIAALRGMEETIRVRVIG